MIGNTRLIQIILFSLGGIFLLALITIGVGVGKTITVDDDGCGDYEMIQDAVDNATAGDTIRVHEGEYIGGIVVNRSVSIIGNGSAHTLIRGQNSSTMMISVTADSVRLQGFTILGDGNFPHIIELISNAGIRVVSSHCDFSNIIIQKAYFGIQMAVCESNTLSNLTIDGCSKGIDLMLTGTSTISGNTIKNSSLTAIYLSLSTVNIIHNNTIENSGISGIHLANSNYNLIDENHLLENADGITLIQTQNNQLLSNTVVLHEHGILVNGSTTTTLRGNLVTNNRYGVYFYHSLENDLNHSSFSNNSRDIVINDSTTNDLTHLPPSTNILIIESEKDGDDQFEIPNWMPMLLYGIVVVIGASIFFQRKKKNE